MIKKSYVYGIQGLTDMIAYLKDLQTNISNAPEAITNEAAIKAQHSIESKLSTMNLDGNMKGRVAVTDITDGKRVSHIGDQVAFLEFGTGMVGKESPHPLAPEYNWQYYIDSIFKDEVYGQLGWWFEDEFHIGIPAGRAVYNTGVEIRNQLHQIVKEKVKL